MQVSSRSFFSKFVSMTLQGQTPQGNINDYFATGQVMPTLDTIQNVRYVSASDTGKFLAAS